MSRYDHLPLGAGVLVKNEESHFEVDVKRFYLPATITAKCPHCGKEVEHDLSDDYLSYPTANEPFDHLMYCDGPKGEDDHEFRVRVKLTIRLEEVVS